MSNLGVSLECYYTSKHWKGALFALSTCRLIATERTDIPQNSEGLFQKQKLMQGKTTEKKLFMQNLTNRNTTSMNKKDNVTSQKTHDKTSILEGEEKQNVKMMKSLKSLKSIIIILLKNTQKQIHVIKKSMFN